MESVIELVREQFTERERTLVTAGSLGARVFRYESGVEAVRLTNDKGEAILLPFMGQMVWRLSFLGRDLTMRSIFGEPQPCRDCFTESYGCFVMHCGMTAMGNPTAADTHPPHGELPFADYQRAYLRCGEDERGAYLALGGVYTHKRASELHYEFCPECRLYAGATQIELTVAVTNRKDLPLEYYYLCHINHRPVDGARLYDTARGITVHREVPDGYPEPMKSATEAYLDRLEADPNVMRVIDQKEQSYAPEIVFTCDYAADENGEAHTMMLLPDGYACYVRHRPDELPYGVRWIARTKDEDAIGMVLPATAQHLGRNYCREHGQQRVLLCGETATFHMCTGLLTPEQANDMKQKF